MNIKLVNMYGKDIRIITTHPNLAYRQFVIVAGGSSQIRSRHLAAQSIYITAYDSATFSPLTLNGMQSQSVSASIKPVSYVFYIPSGKKILFPYMAICCVYHSVLLCTCFYACVNVFYLDSHLRFFDFKCLVKTFR